MIRWHVEIDQTSVWVVVSAPNVVLLAFLANFGYGQHSKL